MPGGFLRVTFLPFTHTIYTLITHKSKGGYSEIGFLQHTYPSFRERELLILNERIILASSPSFSHCHTLRGDLYLNTTHTFSECRKCFGTWETLEICQKKPVRLGRCNWAYYGIQKVTQDMVPRSLVGVGAWST